jgi:hypothetical protein
LEGGPPGFRPRFTAAVLLRNSTGRLVRFHLRDDCPLWCEVPLASANAQLGNCRRVGHDPDVKSYNPRQATRVRFHLPGLGFSLFARHY